MDLDEIKEKAYQDLLKRCGNLTYPEHRRNASEIVSNIMIDMSEYCHDKHESTEKEMGEQK